MNAMSETNMDYSFKDLCDLIEKAPDDFPYDDYNISYYDSAKEFSRKLDLLYLDLKKYVEERS